MPIGYLVSVTLVAWCTLFALAPPRPRHSHPTNVSFYFGFLVNELTFVALYWLVANTLLAFSQGDINSPVGRLASAVAIVATVGLGVVAWRGLRTGPAIDVALEEGLGRGWQSSIDAGLAAQWRAHLPWARILLAPFVFGRRDVERLANLRYGEAGSQNLLDVYRHRSHPSGGPILVYLHGGAFRIGRKNREARPLLYRLASHGWVCISANYRLRPKASFPDQLIDVKKVVAWAREHAAQHGADPDLVFVAGSSAGGHLASLAALTANDPALQPGFEGANTTVAGAISLYGYYGPGDSAEVTPSSPLVDARPDAPPFFVAHGDRDTIVLVEDARRFVESLRRASPNPVVYAELHGAQHVFDLFHSVRFDTVVAAIERFTAWVRSRDGLTRADGAPPGQRRGRPPSGGPEPADH